MRLVVVEYKAQETMVDEIEIEEVEHPDWGPSTWRMGRKVVSRQKYNKIQRVMGKMAAILYIGLVEAKDKVALRPVMMKVRSCEACEKTGSLSMPLIRLSLASHLHIGRLLLTLFSAPCIQ